MDRAMHLGDLESEIAAEEDALRELLQEVMKDPLRAAVEEGIQELEEQVADLRGLVNNSANDQGIATRRLLEEHARKQRKEFEASTDQLSRIEETLTRTAEAVEQNDARLRAALVALEAASSERSTRLEKQVRAAAQHLERFAMEREQRMVTGLTSVLEELEARQTTRADAATNSLVEIGAASEQRLLAGAASAGAELEGRQVARLDAAMQKLADHGARSEERLAAAVGSSLKALEQQFELQRAQQHREAAAFSAAIRRLIWIAGAGLLAALAAGATSAYLLLRALA